MAEGRGDGVFVCVVEVGVWEGEGADGEEEWRTSWLDGENRKELFTDSAALLMDFCGRSAEKFFTICKLLLGIVDVVHYPLLGFFA